MRSACLRRVRLLEEAGVIRGYQATLDRDEVGLGMMVFVGVKVERHNDTEANAFREAVTALPGVRDIRSNFAIQTVKTPGALPLGHLPG